MNFTLVVQFKHHYYLQKKKSKLTLVIYVCFDDFFFPMALQIEPKALYTLGKLYQ